MGNAGRRKQPRLHDFIWRYPPRLAENISENSLISAIMQVTEGKTMTRHERPDTIPGTQAGLLSLWFVCARDCGAWQ